MDASGSSHHNPDRTKMRGNDGPRQPKRDFMKKSSKINSLSWPVPGLPVRHLKVAVLATAPRRDGCTPATADLASSLDAAVVAP